MTGRATDDPLTRGRALAEKVSPGLEAALRERYNELLPGFAESLVSMAWGHVYSRGALDERTRLIATVAALTALGGQTRPQLKVNVANALNAGASEREIAEIIFQMSLYGGFPATINALNAAMEVFDEKKEAA